MRAPRSHRPTALPLALLLGFLAFGCSDESTQPLALDPSNYIAPTPCELDRTCGGGAMDFSGGIVISSAITWFNCMTQAVSSSDRDHDRVDDECEYQIAKAFSPFLMFHDLDRDTSRESYWAAYVDWDMPMNELKIFYALAYHVDHGNRGFFDHWGDSEFIVLTVKYQGASEWALISATTSAHWGTHLDATKTSKYDKLKYPWEYRGVPYIYVAKNKHANYRSVASCNDGPDACVSHSRKRGRARVLRSRNLGNSWQRLINCVDSQSPSRYPGRECFWSANSFNGWHGPTNHGALGGSYPL